MAQERDGCDDEKPDRSFSEIINARGVFTPLGVSRSPKEVSDAAAEALSRYFVMGELHDAVGQHIADSTGAPAATVVHCVASAITLAVAACITGTNKKLIEQLPFTNGLKNRVVLPRPHAVNYGQPIEQAVRLAGAEPVLIVVNCTYPTLGLQTSRILARII